MEVRKVLCVVAVFLLVCGVVLPPAVAGGLWEHVKEKWSEVKEKVSEKYRRTKERVSHGWNRIKEGTRERYEETKEKIKQKVSEGKERLEHRLEHEWNEIKSRAKFKSQRVATRAWETWKNMPEEDRKKVKMALIGGAVLVGVTYMAVHHPGAVATAAKYATAIMIKDGKLAVYDPETKEIIESAAMQEISNKTHGLVKSNNFEVESVEKMPDGKYRIKVSADVNLFWLIPWKLEKDIIIDPATGKAQVDMAWWETPPFYTA